MTYKLPLIAALAATLATPVLAQDINDMLNPRAMIAELGLSQIMQGNHGNQIAAPRVVEVAPAEIAALQLDTTVLRSPRPLLRPSTLDIADAVRVPSADAAVAAPVASDVRAMIGAMEVAAADAPAGANTLVVSGGDAVAVNGTNTAVIQSDGPAPRLSLWQRIFGN
ncbi:hypothetical protein [Gymnodinialimonas hymeniacidonis]|uniref:hypothetical protein n=1 Tax=Gymnodinialimonas hymeniacidonis TaxID=3126508 RepID=UPI0034C5E646